jgi:hypothetical protein
MSLSKGGTMTNLLPRSSSMMRGTRLDFSDSYKKRIWSSRNSRSDISSTDNDLACFTALR